MVMTLIILCGGEGSRISHLLDGLPKPMLDLCGAPVLLRIIEQFRMAGTIGHLYLCAGFRSESIVHFSKYVTSVLGVPVTVSIESEPLGTGGALAKLFKDYEISDCVITNGDTLLLGSRVKEELQEFISLSSSACLIVPGNPDRYDYCKIADNGQILGWAERVQRPEKKVPINTGVWRLQRNLIEEFVECELCMFGFEEFIESYFARASVTAFEADLDFIDIGVEESYKKAVVYFSSECHLSRGIRIWQRVMDPSSKIPNQS